MNDVTKVVLQAAINDRKDELKIAQLDQENRLKWAETFKKQAAALQEEIAALEAELEKQ